MTASSFQTTRRNPADKPSLQDEEENPYGQDDVDSGGTGEPPVLAEVALEGQEARRYGLQVVVLDKGDREEELVPCTDPGNERDGQETGPAQGQYDAEQHLQFVRTVYAGCILEVAWQSDEVRAQQQRRQRRENRPVDQDQAKPRVRQLQGSPEEEQRNKEELERHRACHPQVEQDGVCARQVQTGHRVGARCCDDANADYCADG